MDKVQKQLIDTYFRKRRIANNQSGRYGYKIYETIYALENDIPFDLSKFNTDNIANILKIRPSLEDKLNLNELSGKQIKEMLSNHNSLIDVIDLSELDLSELDAYDIRDILYKQPSLINKFDLSKLNDLDGNSIVLLLDEQPILIDKLANVFDGRHIAAILTRRPELVDRFDLSKINNFFVHVVLKHQPQLAKYFKY